MKDDEIRGAWLAYSSQYPHQWAYLKNSSQYKNQISVVNGKAVGNKPNLYCLFTEQCKNLLKKRLAGFLFENIFQVMCCR